MKVQVKRNAVGELTSQVFHVKWLAYGQNESVLYSVGAEPVDVPDEVGRYFLRTYAQYVCEIPAASTEPLKPPLEVHQVVTAPAEKSALRSRGSPKITKKRK